MNDRSEVRSQVALAALLDTDCLELAMLDAELVADVALWSSDGASEVLASHPFVSRMVVAAVMSPRPQVRATVAARPDLDPMLYPMLASDEEQSVRARVAANHAAPHAVLDHLAHDPVPVVRDAAVSELRRRAYPTAHAS